MGSYVQADWRVLIGHVCYLRLCLAMCCACLHCAKGVPFYARWCLRCKTLAKRILSGIELWSPRCTPNTVSSPALLTLNTPRTPELTMSSHLWEVQSGKARGPDLRLREADVCIDITWYRPIVRSTCMRPALQSIRDRTGCEQPAHSIIVFMPQLIRRTRLSRHNERTHRTQSAQVQHPNECVSAP